MPIPVTQILLGQQQVDLGWIYQVISHLVLVERKDEGSTGAAAFDGITVVRDWVGGQLQYFAKSSRLEEERAVLFGRLSIGAVIGGLTSALGAIILSLIEPELEEVRHVLVALSAALPVSAFILENASERFGIEAQARIRHRLHQVYEKCEEMLEKPGLDHATRDRVILETGREAVVEMITWTFLRRIKPVKVSI